MTRLDRLIEAEKQLVPTSRYMCKDKSWLMWLANLIARWFNKRFMTDFTTTVGTKSYFPAALLDPRVVDDQAVAIECHEFVHKWDYWTHKLTFGIKYTLSRKFRRNAELRGYTMSMYWYWLRFGTQVDPETYVKHFTSSDYMYMDKEGTYSLEQLRLRQQMFMTDEAQFLAPDEQAPYRLIRNFLKIEGLLHANVT